MEGRDGEAVCTQVVVDAFKYWINSGKMSDI